VATNDDPTEDLDASKIKAALKDGVLKVIIPRSPTVHREESR